MKQCFDQLKRGIEKITSFGIGLQFRVGVIYAEKNICYRNGGVDKYLFVGVIVHFVRDADDPRYENANDQDEQQTMIEAIIRFIFLIKCNLVLAEHIVLPSL